MGAFGELELDSLLGAGAVTRHSARLWGRAPRAGELELRLRSGEREHARVPITVEDGGRDYTFALTYPDDFEAAPALAPDTAYHAELRRWGEQIAEARFRTAPADRHSAPTRWSFGAFSCHQPFKRHGQVSEEGAAMLSAAQQVYCSADARFVLMMGDQIYGDYPAPLSLFDDDYFRRVAPPGRRSILACSPAEVRQIYQQRHRQFWALEGFQAIQSSFASYPMLDDHEIVDNFGTDPAHSEPAWDAVRDGALDAFFDYQVSRVLARNPDGSRPRELDYGFTWGPAAVYVMDIRSQRRTSRERTEVYTRAQLEALRAFLDAHADHPLLCLVTTIPIVFLDSTLLRVASTFLSEGSDLHERWSHPLCIEHRDRLIRVLHEHSLRHPGQQMLLLGGDVHSGAVYQIDFDGGPRWYQMVSSAISNTESFFMTKACEAASHAISEIDAGHGVRADVCLLETAAPGHRNPIGHLNAGLVDVVERAGVVELDLKLFTYGDGGVPELAFSSGLLPPRR